MATVVKLIEVRLGENGCALKVVEGADSLSLTRGQVDRAIAQQREEGVPLYTYQEFGDGLDTWVAFLTLLNEEFGPDPKHVKIEACIHKHGKLPVPADHQMEVPE